MKTKKLLLLAIGALFTHILFYNKGLGINLIFFSILVLALQILHRPRVLKNPKWWIPALGTPLIALAFNLTNGELLIPLFYMSLMVLAFVHVEAHGFWLLSGFHFAASLFTSSWNFVTDFIPVFSADTQENPGAESQNHKQKEPLTSELQVRALVVPLGVSVVFFVLYSFANQDFTNSYLLYVEDLEPAAFFAYLVFAWLLITLCFGTPIAPLRQFQIWISDLIALQPENTLKPALESLREKEALRTFGSLTLLLLILLGFEIKSCLESDANLAENLHGNVYAVIFSILTAILVVMYFFSGSIFQLRQINPIRQLAFTWIGLNALLASIGIYKTLHYINALGLTYKRVATMEFLLSILLCLALVVIALLQKKGNEWLMERCLGTCYGLFIAFSLINWDRQVVAYHYQHFPDRDPKYYERLSLSAYAQYLEMGINTPYWGQNVYQKMDEFEIQNAGSHWLGKTLEDRRIAETLRKNPVSPRP